MQIGRLKYKIEILGKTEIKSTTGAITKAYRVLFTLPADIIFKSGSKAVAEGVVFNSQFLEINIRFKKELDETMLIRWDGRIYKINFIEPMAFRASQKINAERINDKLEII